MTTVLTPLQGLSAFADLEATLTRLADSNPGMTPESFERLTLSACQTVGQMCGYSAELCGRLSREGHDACVRNGLVAEGMQ